MSVIQRSMFAGSIKFTNFVTCTNFIATIFLFLALASSGAQAIVINFDELEYLYAPDSDFDCFCDHPIGDHYLSQGLRIFDGYLSQYSSENLPYIVSEPNFLLGGNPLHLDFVGALPTSVGMTVSSLFGEAILFNVYGPSGLILHTQSTGWAGSDDDLPYFDKQFISFTSATGISSITVDGYYQRKVNALIDDLTYDYTPVAEPSSLVLFSIGLVGCLLLRRRTLNTI